MLVLTKTTSVAPAEIHRSAVSRLIDSPVGGYAAGGTAAAEPTAWAAIALAAAGESDAARAATEWLAERQAKDGSVSVTLDDDQPGWPTSLAMLAWDTVDADRYAGRIARGAEWALAQEPWTQPRSRIFGHDSTLEGWSWAPATHSWLEPTAFFVLALRRAGWGDHPRSRQGVATLVDRLLPTGGANYGNTSVLGQDLLQHVQPSGIAALALAAEPVDDARYPLTLDYLETAIDSPTGAASFAYALLGLAANDRPIRRYDTALADAWGRAKAAAGVYKTALVALAAAAFTAPDAALAFTEGV